MEPSGDRWPDARSYFPAVSSPKQCIRDNRLHRLSVERHLGGRVPFGRNGRFGSVFKFTGNGEAFALKVFIRNAPKRQLRYRLIGEHLAQAKAATPRLISFNYDEKGIRVKGSWYPTLVMDWSSGIPLDKYLAKWLESRPGDRARLCNEWVETVRDLRSHKIAHGDLHHENVLVKEDGTFQLIDYDGMFVPEMRDEKLPAAEVGWPAYQHPARGAAPYRTDYFDERLDDFSALVILLNLAAVDNHTWTAHHNDDDKLLISEQDLCKPSESDLLAGLAERLGPVATLTRLLKQAAEGAIEAIPPFETVVADPDVQALLKGEIADQPTPARQRPLGSRRPSLLPQFPDEPSSSSSARPADVPKSRDRTSPAGRERRTAPQAPTSELTGREKEVARLVAKGLSTSEIANELKLAQQTVTRHLRNLRTKAGSDSMEALTSWARANFPPPPERQAGKPPSPRPKKPQKKPTAKTGPPRAATAAAARRPASPPPREAPIASPSKPQPQRQAPAGQLPDLAGLFSDPSSSPMIAAENLALARLTEEGEAHLRANRNQKALRAFDQALSHQPRFVPALVGRGEARRRMRRFEEALSDLKLALSLQPKNARALQVRSETNRDAGRKVRAWADRVRARWRQENA